MNTQNTNLG